MRSRLLELAIVELLSLGGLPSSRLFLNQRRFRDLLLAVSISLPPAVYAGGGSLNWLVSVSESAMSPVGLTLGVGEGVISVDGVTSTSSASLHHFLRRV